VDPPCGVDDTRMSGGGYSFTSHAVDWEVFVYVVSLSSVLMTIPGAPHGSTSHPMLVVSLRCVSSNCNIKSM
jgi:hypothetical protein